VIIASAPGISDAVRPLVPLVPLAVLVVVAACGGGSEPPHLRSAARVCSAAQPALDRTGERVARAAEEYRRSESSGALIRVRDGLIELDRLMAQAFNELRSQRADRGYASFVAAWGSLTGDEGFLNGEPYPEGIQVVLDGHRLGSRRLAGIARDLGLEACTDPLRSTTKARVGPSTPPLSDALDGG
jgi:hypothetical protein